MRLAVVAGEKRLLTQLIHFLHTLGRVQLVSAAPEETTFMHPAGSHTYFPVERYLTTVQSIREYLRLKPPRRPNRSTRRSSWSPSRGTGDTLRRDPHPPGTDRSAHRRTAGPDRELRLIQPLRGLNVPLDLWDGYATIATIAVRMDADTPCQPCPQPARCLTGTRSKARSSGSWPRRPNTQPSSGKSWSLRAAGRSNCPAAGPRHPGRGGGAAHQPRHGHPARDIPPEAGACGHRRKARRIHIRGRGGTQGPG